MLKLCLLIIIDVKLTPSGFTAYLFVWMGRRDAGLVLHGERLDSGSYLSFYLGVLV